MSLFEDKEILKAQIVDTERMLSMVGDHPFMGISLKEKLNSLYKSLEECPEHVIEPKIKILFSGNAVFGSRGIKSSFISKAMLPFEEMIKTQVALTRFGGVSKRGQARKSTVSSLYITSLPIGSFGVELSKVDAEDLFAEQDVANAMKQVIELVERVADNDAAFEEAINDTPKRNVSNLSKFLKETAAEHSFIKMISGDTAVEISEESVQAAYLRISSTKTDDEEVFIEGFPRGILLDSGKFEAQDTNGDRIYGLINAELTEEDLIRYEQSYLNRRCRLHLRKVHTLFKTGNENTSYELLEITLIDN